VNISDENLLVILLVGLVAGWLAGQVVRGGGFGLIGDINYTGVLGAFIGDWILPRLGIHLHVGTAAHIWTPPSERLSCCWASSAIIAAGARLNPRQVCLVLFISPFHTFNLDARIYRCVMYHLKRAGCHPVFLAAELLFARPMLWLINRNSNRARSWSDMKSRQTETAP
jgi:uncharacterized membrane protein YeaQ/YmgE (transglycosylase-associated protein family)